MAELTPQERLQPSLLDRLTDENPQGGLEARDQRVISWQRLRDAVCRDLTWLLNCVHLEASEDLSAWPLIARSTLNYGMPETSGVPVANINVEALQKRVRQAILDFEQAAVQLGPDGHGLRPQQLPPGRRRRGLPDASIALRSRRRRSSGRWSVVSKIKTDQLRSRDVLLLTLSTDY